MTHVFQKTILTQYCPGKTAQERVHTFFIDINIGFKSRFKMKYPLFTYDLQIRFDILKLPHLPYTY